MTFSLQLSGPLAAQQVSRTPQSSRSDISRLVRWRHVSRQPHLVVKATQAPPSPAPAPAPSPSSSFRPGERKGFVEEMRIRAMKLHTKSQAKEGEKEETEKPLAKWEPSVGGYIQFLVDSRHLFHTMETLMAQAPHPSYKEFVGTGLERSKALDKDLEWFRAQGHTIPEVDKAGSGYAQYLEELAHSNPPAFICHFYNVYFAHSAGGRMIGKKVSEMILDGRVLEFYKWEGDLQELLQGVRDKLNKVAEEWSRQEKDVCLEETSKSFKLSGDILRCIFS